MHTKYEVKHGQRRFANILSAIGRRWMIITALAVATTAALVAQGGELQQKFATMKQSVAENRQKLEQYQWVETTQLTLKGDAKPPTQNLCRYGADGQVQKTPLGAPPPPSGGRLKQRMIAKKKAEMEDYMDEVKALLALYVPPDPQKMQQDYQAGKLSFNPVGGVVNFIFRDYAQPGDQMTLTFDPAQSTIVSLAVNTYMDDPKNVVTLQVQMASLPDGTRHVQQTVLNATAKQLVATTTSSEYQKLGS